MENLVSKTYLFIEFLSMLTYREIAILRNVSKKFRDKIDNIKVWNQIIQRDYPNLMILSDLSSSISLSLLKNKVKNKDLAADINVNVGVFGSMGIFQREINEPDEYSKAGFLGSMKEFVCNLGFCRINLVAFPKVSYATCQKKLIPIFLILSKCEEGWEENLNKTIEEVHSIGIKKYAIGLRTTTENTSALQVQSAYKHVALVDKLTRENIVKMLKVLVGVYNDEALENDVDAGVFRTEAETVQVTEEKKKKGCEIF